MAHHWTKSIFNRRRDPLEAYYGRPLIGTPGAETRYVGRVVVELWQGQSRERGASEDVAFTIDPAEGGGSAERAALFQRIAAVLPTRIRDVLETETGWQ